MTWPLLAYRSILARRTGPVPASGPGGIRSESVLIRPYNMATRAAPFDSLRIDDTGDVATNPFNLPDAVSRIETHFAPCWPTM